MQMRCVGQFRNVKGITATFLLLCATYAQAQSVSETELRDYAARWLERNPLAARYRASQGVPLQIKSTEWVQLGTSQLPFHLVHLSPCGYILMNSDRRLPPVVSFSFSGDADLERREDNPLYQLLFIQHQKATRRIASPASARIAYQWDVQPQLGITSETGVNKADSQVIGPLLATSWGQGNHYNEYCPTAPDAPDSYDGRTPVGCVAVAFAQIMKYHQWPYRGNGSASYDDAEGQIVGIHTAVLSDRYDWAKMQNEYYAFGREPNEVAQAVSALMYELGVAAKTDYEPSWASAGSAELAGSIRNYFLYETPVQLGTSDSDRFADALFAELAEQRPCVASIPGHAFVIDGYMQEGQGRFFHINYGWSGQNDGWHLLEDVQNAAIVEVWTGIRPVLAAIPLDGEDTAKGVELRWVLPSTRSEEVDAVNVLKRITVSGTFSDPVEDFQAFEATSTSDHVDWVLSPQGDSDACFYKPAGGYGNREYHLTSTHVFRPQPDSRLVFQTKYMLLDDQFSVAISTDDGATFSSVWSVSSAVSDSWTEVQVPLGTFSGRDIRIRLEYVPGRFYLEGGVWIDEIAIVSTEWYDWNRVQRIEALQVYRAESTTTFWDQAEDFSMFSPTSTNDYQDWFLSTDGLTGLCFHKPAGGYGNVEYHLTSSRSFQPGPDTWLIFKAKYALGHDGLSVSVSTDGARTFSEVWSVSETIRHRWTEIPIPLSAFSGHDTVFRFEYVPGGFFADRGIWIDDIRLVDITGAEYLDCPVYHTSLVGLPQGPSVLAYQVESAGQIHPRSETFTVSIPQGQ